MNCNWYNKYRIFVLTAAAVLLFEIAAIFAVFLAVPGRSARFVLSHTKCSDAGGAPYGKDNNDTAPDTSAADADIPSGYDKKTFFDRVNDLRLLIPVVSSNLDTSFNGVICVEAGSVLDADTLSEAAGERVEPVSDLSAIPTDDIGCYSITLICKGSTRSCVLMIADSISPVIETARKNLWVGDKPDIDDFIVSCSDSTYVSFSYVTEPKCEEEGTTRFVIEARDRGGNTAEAELECEVKTDTEPPVISGASDRRCFIGENVLYKDGVTVHDNRDGNNISLNVDISSVNAQEEGDYPVTFSAVDSSGLSSSVTVIFTFEYTREDQLINKLNEQVDLIIKEIIRDDMSEREKAKAIYNWVYRNIHYVFMNSRGTWYESALDGLRTHGGDCFTFASISKAMLTAAGLENVDVVREYTPIRPNTHHYWNMVKVDGIWYHFDATPRDDGEKFFLVLSEDLLAFSNSHGDTHLFDPDKYPKNP